MYEEIRNYLDIPVTGVRVLVRYDIEKLSETTYQKALGTVFSEPPVDILYEEAFEKTEQEQAFSVEYLPGQFDQRADSAEQCVKLLNEEEEPVIRSATTYVIAGAIKEDEMQRIKEYCINPVDSREASMTKPETLVTVFDEPDDGTAIAGIISVIGTGHDLSGFFTYSEVFSGTGKKRSFHDGNTGIGYLLV